jgi:glycosyltransferase involved in cell wall biosynthesis
MGKPSTASSPRYVIISPVKDEARYIEFTLKSLIAQSLKPVLWILVDDGSRDGTTEIIRRYLQENSFIRMVQNPHAGTRRPGSAVIRAFNFGYEFLSESDYDFIVKLDSDLSFGPDYFEKIIGKFIDDERLGIASGVYFEKSNSGAWREVKMPSYHAAGASKVMRRKCFEEIGGFIVAAGWDTVDEIRAMARGWKTRHFKDLRIKHHKIEGSGIGQLRTSVMHGEIYYLTGGSKLFFVLKVFHRMGWKPYVLSALALLYGYLRALKNKKPLLVSKEEAVCYQSLLNKRLRLKADTVFALD